MVGGAVLVTPAPLANPRQVESAMATLSNAAKRRNIRPAEPAPESYHLSSGAGLVLEIRRGYQFWLYAARPLASDYGTAFHLERAGGPAEGYDVCLDGANSSCDCPDATYRQRQCKRQRLLAAYLAGDVKGGAA